jgi:hypothetical protein
MVNASPSPGPKKETARIAVLPDPSKVSGFVQMKKPLPLICMSEASAPVPPLNVAIAPQPRVKIDVLQMPLCWTLVAASVGILLIQIWNYVS